MIFSRFSATLAAALLALGFAGCSAPAGTKDSPDAGMIHPEITRDLGNFCHSIDREFGDVTFETSGESLPHWVDKTEEIGLADVRTPAFAVGYINNDDIPDIFAPNGDNLKVFLGCADRPGGTELRFYETILLTEEFHQGRRIPQDHVFASIIGDVDNDGLSDIIYGMENGDVVILSQEGFGQFNPKKLINVYNHAQDRGRIRTITLYDLNKDNLQDVLIAIEGGVGEAGDDGTVGILQPNPDFKNFLLLNQGNRTFKDITDETVQLLEPGMFPTYSLMVLPYAALTGRGDCLVIGNDLADDHIFCAERNGEIPDKKIAFPSLPHPNATMGLDYLIHRDGKTVYVVFSNTGKPMLIEIDENMNIRQISDGIPMRMAGNLHNHPDNILDIPDRARVNWAIFLGSYFDAQARDYLLAFFGGEGHHQATFPGSQGVGIYIADFIPGETPQFKALHARAGEQFDPTAVESNYSAAELVGPDGCPGLLIGGYRQRGYHLPTPIQYLKHNCAGRRVGFRLKPEDYGAVVNLIMQDGTHMYATLEQPSLASGRQPVAMLGISDKEPLRAIVTWGDGERTIVDSVSTRTYTIVRKNGQ